MTEANKKNILKSTDKVFQLLETLTKNEKLTITNLAKLTGYNKSTTQRIINTLKELKYVTQDPNTLEYHASLKLYELGNRVIERYAILNIAVPYLRELSDKTNETVSLGILKNDELIYLYDHESKSPLRAHFDTGMKMPFHCSAKGKCIVAFNDTISIDNIKLEKLTEKTITNKEDFRRELNKIREQGYAVDNEEYVDGLVCVSTPILNSSNKAIGAIAITVFSKRATNEKIQEFAARLKLTAKSIEKDMY